MCSLSQGSQTVPSRSLSDVAQLLNAIPKIGSLDHIGDLVNRFRTQPGDGWRDLLPQDSLSCEVCGQPVHPADAQRIHDGSTLCDACLPLANRARR